MTTTAEGVETEQQRNLLSILGCTEMQGICSAAISAAEVRQLLASQRGTAVVGGLKRPLTLAIETAATIRNRAGWNAMNRGIET